MTFISNMKTVVSTRGKEEVLYTDKALRSMADVDKFLPKERPQSLSTET